MSDLVASRRLNLSRISFIQKDPELLKLFANSGQKTIRDEKKEAEERAKYQNPN